jgi:Aspartyl protease
MAVPLIIERDSDENDFASVMIDAAIAGHPYRLILDTGGARTHLNSDDYLASLPAVGEHTSAGSFGREVTYPVVRIPGLVAGDLRVDAVEVTCSDDQLGGVLGMDVLGRYRCHLRLDAGVLELDALPDRALDQGLLVDSRGHAYIEVSWPGVTASACVDTGAPPTVVNKGFWHAHPELFTQIGMVTGTDASGDQMDTPLLLMNGPVIGTRPFTAHKVVAADISSTNQTADYPNDLILGYSTLRQADWLFDFPAKIWAITAMTTPEHDSPRA